jgi:hypothetical protein
MSVTTVSSKSKSTPAKRRAPAKTEPSDDEIRILAYTLYERRAAGGQDGDAASDWIEAERQLKDS